MELQGTWSLAQWRRIAPDGTVTFPLGRDATGTLIYTGDGHMSVMLAAAQRPHLDSTDPLSGDVEQRANAYSGCLAYFGTYEQQGDTVVHRIAASLYPNWSETEEPRIITAREGHLILEKRAEPGAPPAPVNEIEWARSD